MPRNEQDIIRLYKQGKNFSQISRLVGVDRHKVPHILVKYKIELRTPFNGTKAEWSKIYEKTPKGFLMRTYRNMQSRVSGVQKKKAHLYKGLSLLPRSAFYEWAWNDTNFWRLYKQWAATDYEQRLTPSINRLDSTKGYELDNIEWLTHSVNSSLGGASFKRRHVNALIEVYNHVGN